MAGSTQSPVLVPIGTIGGKLDNDDPNYVFAPDLYLTLALAYDSMAAPTVTKGADGVLQPGYAAMQQRLAVGWEEQENGDWIVRLRPGVRSNRGNEWTSADLVWTFEKISAQGVMASWRWREVIGLKDIEVIDRHTVRYRLRASYPTFPNWLISVSPNMVDSAAIKANISPSDPWGIGWLNGHVAGFGGFDLAAMDREHLAFSARADYWMGKPQADVEVRKFATRRECIDLLREARPVVLAGLTPDESVALMKRGDVDVFRTWAGHISVEIDFTQKPFDDIRVRQALALATPTEKLIRDGMLGQAKPWKSPVKSISQWYSDSGWDFAFDIAKAKQLLAEAGQGQGFTSDFYIAQRPDSQRMAEIIAAAWREIGVELVMRDIGQAPEGWLPPLFLRTECAHNLSEPIYDLAHDYVAMNPIFPLPGGAPHVGNWRPRWKKNPEAIGRFVKMLCECDAHRKRQQFDDYQSWLIGQSTSIFIAEGHQVMAANRHVPASMVAPETRFFHALNHQNCTTNYLPAR